MVYGGITSFTPTRFKRVKHRRKMPFLGMISLAVFVGHLGESPSPGLVGIGVSSEVELRGEMGRGKGTCSAKFSRLARSGRVGRANSS